MELFIHSLMKISDSFMHSVMRAFNYCSFTRSAIHSFVHSFLFIHTRFISSSSLFIGSFITLFADSISCIRSVIHSFHLLSISFIHPFFPFFLHLVYAQCMCLSSISSVANDTRQHPSHFLTLNSVFSSESATT